MARRDKLLRAGISAAAAALIVGEAQTLASAGSSASDAAKITGENVLVSSGSGGVILPVCHAGDSLNIKNESGSNCVLYPPTGATINGTTSVTLATAESCVVFFSSATACHTIPTNPT